MEAELDYKAQRPPMEREYNAHVALRVAGKSFILLVEAKKAVYPREVRQMIWHLRERSPAQRSRQERMRLTLLIAETISPGAKELLRKEGVGYYDSGGSLFLSAPGAYIYIDKPPPKTLAKSIRALFSGRRAQVLHALLVRQRDWFGVTELAREALVSPATASQVLTELDRFEWLASRGQGPSKERHLREPGALLDAWVKQLVTTRLQTLPRYYVAGIKADALAKQLADVFESREVDYALTHEAAAQQLAPFLSHVSQVRARVLVGASVNAALIDLNARPVTEGANLVIIEVKSPGDLLFRERVSEVWLASPIQIYLDLLRGEGRGKEMAEHFRKERIGF